MGKGIIIAIILVTLTVTLSFIPFTNKRKIIIKAQLYDVARQINDLNNWKKWNTDFGNTEVKVSGSYNSNQSAKINAFYSYTLHHISPLVVSLTRKNKNVSTFSTITLSSSLNDSSTYVAWGETLTIFEMIKGAWISHYSRKSSLKNLKQLMEDINRKYGFFIKLVPVKDTLILTAETRFLDNTSAHVTAALYQSLQSFISKNHLPAEKKYFYKTVLGNDKIAVGIPVYKKINNDSNIKFLELPANGRLVEGDYNGSYANKQDIYKALNDFMLNQHLKQVAQPFEKYNVADTVLQPGANVNIKIFYPVF